MSIRTDVDTRNEAWAKDKSSFGQRMLAKMGWEEGKGLGKNKQGTVNSLRAVRRSENLGIGASTDLHGEEGFNVTKSNFLGVLEKLKEEHGVKNEKKNKKSKKRKDGEGKITLAKNRVSAGHSRKMRESKDLSKKSKEDMAAIFGMKVDAYTASSVWGSLKQSSISASDSKDKDLKIQPQKNTKHIVSLDSSPVPSDNDNCSQQAEAQNKQIKNKKKKDKSSKKSSSKKEKKKKKRKDCIKLEDGSKRSKKKPRKE